MVVKAITRCNFGALRSVSEAERVFCILEV